MNQDQSRPAAGLTAEDRHAVETLYRAFADHDPDLLDEAVTPDWLDIPPAPGQGPGPDGLKPVIRAFLKAFPDLDVTIEDMFGRDGRAGVRAQITGTHRGEWFGIAPTGRRVTVALHDFHHLRDGRISHTWHLEDWFGMLQQVGAWPSVASETEAGR
ncbi:ester cyclase [Inquilinus limosus]|uniref:Ester cyclase n=1 Tax=Inquilinus limosus MP06 TaxID=1398085 RepID=A0A0A0D4Z1_9PROT|nr:ester cyclase [Inquilinus limosus]KGM33761.1 ester cyclase [Inquilinus limosus MP06]